MRFLYLQYNIIQGFGGILGTRNMKPRFAHVKSCTYQNLAKVGSNWKMINKIWKTKFELTKSVNSWLVKYGQKWMHMNAQNVHTHGIE